MSLCPECSATVPCGRRDCSHGKIATDPGTVPSYTVETTDGHMFVWEPSKLPEPLDERIAELTRRVETLENVLSVLTSPE